MVNGTAESRSHWVTYAIGTTATVVFGTKGVGTVSKTGAAATKAAVQKSVTTTQNALQSLRTLELPQISPYTPRLELALSEKLPVNAVDGNQLKEQLMLMAKRSDAGGKGEVSKEISYIAHVKEAKNVIAERTKGLDLNEHPTKTKQMSSKKMKELKNKVDNRTITKQEYADYIWNKKFAKRRDKGVKEFWYQEQRQLLNNEALTRDWSQEQLKDILTGNTPKFDGKAIAGHHSYSASKYPHLVDKGEVIYPTTFNEHLKRWHGGNWKKIIASEPIKPIKDF